MENKRSLADFKRVTDVIRPLTVDRYIKIPKSTMAVARFRGNEGHSKMETAQRSGFHGIPRNGIEAMFLAGCKQLKLSPVGVPEKRLYRDDVAGKPDLVTDEAIKDWKFTDFNYPETAIQLAGYEWLKGEVRRLFVYHFLGNEGLFIYEVPEAVKSVLRDFFLKLYQRYEEARQCPLAKMALACEWENIQVENEIYMPVAVVLPELTVNNYDDAEKAIKVINIISALEGRGKSLRSQLKRFMQGEGITRLITPDQYVTLYNTHSTKYKYPDDIKEKYKVSSTPTIGMKFIKRGGK